MCASVHLHACVFAHVELQQLFLSRYRPYFFIQSLSLGLKIPNQPSWQASPTGCEGEMGMGRSLGFESNPHACLRSTLPTELSTQPLNITFKFIF